MEYRVAVLEWRDAAYRNCQTSRAEAETFDLQLVVSVGMIVAEHEDRVVLAEDWDPEGDEYRHLSVYPRVCITRMHVFDIHGPRFTAGTTTGTSGLQGVPSPGVGVNMTQFGSEMANVRDQINAANKAPDTGPWWNTREMSDEAGRRIGAEAVADGGPADPSERSEEVPGR